MPEEESIKHPTQVLAQDIIKFTRDIECLHTTLPLFMQIMEILDKESHKKYHTFVEERATEKTKDGDSTTYTFKVDDIAEHDRLRR